MSTTVYRDATEPLDGYALLALDPQYEGSCPCAAFEFEGTRFDAHCWRVCRDCTYAGLHYEGDPTVAQRVLDAFNAMGWSEWELHHGLREGYG